MKQTRKLNHEMKPMLRVGKTPCVTKMDRLRYRLKRGWLTTLQSINEIGLSSLSQRVSVMRSQGINIIDKWVETDSGSRVKAYRQG